LRLWTDDYNSVLPLLRWKDDKKDDTPDQKKDEKGNPPPK
jgi:hypothetical protein